MKAQIIRLVETIERPNVEVQAVPFLHMGQSHGYTILGYRTTPANVIYLEHHDGGQHLDGSKRTTRYLTLWDQQKARASGPEQTRQILLDLTTSL